MNRSSLSVILSGVTILAWWCDPLNGGEIAKDVSVPEIIQHLKENEARAASVVIEGQSENISYDVSGKPTWVQVDRSYRFSRNDHLFKVERKGEHHVKEKKTDTLAAMERDEIIFYSPESTLYVYYFGHKLARKEGVETPIFFPLEFGYEFHRDHQNGDIKPFSARLEVALKEGGLSARKDALSPNLVLLEIGRETLQFRYWIDPDHGYLVVKKEIYEFIPILKRELLLGKVKAVPKQFNGVWFVERAFKEEYDKRGGDPVTKEIFFERTEESFRVTNFQADVKFKPGELEFSPKDYPQLKSLYVRATDEDVDVKTGKRTPRPPPEQKTAPENTVGKPPPDAGK